MLVGNFGDGRINAFKETSPGTFAPDGTMQSTSGSPLVIPGLWAIEFGNGAANNGATTALFYTAGPFAQTEGVFGQITNASTAQTGVTANVPAQLSLSLGTRPRSARSRRAWARTTRVHDGQRDLHRRRRALSVADPSTNAPGHLVNGTFSLPQAAAGQATSAGGTGRRSRRSAASPTTLLTYDRPGQQRRGDARFKQTIGANDALRTGPTARR